MNSAERYATKDRQCRARSRITKPASVARTARLMSVSRTDCCSAISAEVLGHPLSRDAVTLQAEVDRPTGYAQDACHLGDVPLVPVERGHHLLAKDLVRGHRWHVGGERLDA